MDQVAKTRQPLTVTKRGTPVVRIVPVEEEAMELFGLHAVSELLDATGVQVWGRRRALGAAHHSRPADSRQRCVPYRVVIGASRNEHQRPGNICACDDPSSVPRARRRRWRSATFERSVQRALAAAAMDRSIACRCAPEDS
jgi:antitoxin (DNA-binding transcriptional repressor) of toxin-antitoxin stability system